jgi:hypothetical protein
MPLNTGFAGMRFSFILDDGDQQIKSGHLPFFIPNIPFFQHSIIPFVIYRLTAPIWSENKAWSSGPGLFPIPPLAAVDI